MNIPFELHIALRYLLAKRKQAFISVISFISTLGVTVGVMARVIALALMTGLQQELRDRILGVESAYLRLEDGRDRPTIRPRPSSCARCRTSSARRPAILGQGADLARRRECVRSDQGHRSGARAEVTDIRGAMASGSLDALRANDAERPDGILLGSDLAAELGVDGGRLRVACSRREDAVADRAVPRPRRLRVAGIFNLGLLRDRFDVGFVSLDVAKRLLGKRRLDFIQLRVDDIYAGAAIADRSSQLGAST